jgi:hypothetical protein
MIVKKIFLTIIIIFALQDVFATTYICRDGTSLSEKKFFDLCLSCNAKDLRFFLEQQKALLSEIEFKKLINMTSANDRTMFTWLIKKSFVKQESILDALKVLALYEPDLYVGDSLPLEVLIHTYLIYAACAQDTENSSIGVVGLLGIIEEIPYYVQVSLLILDLLKDLKQNFNYKNKNGQSALHKLVENRLRLGEVTKNDLILINRLLQLGADPTIEINTLLEKETTSVVEMAYCCADDVKYKNADRLYALLKRYRYDISYKTWMMFNCVIL